MSAQLEHPPASTAAPSRPRLALRPVTTRPGSRSPVASTDSTRRQAPGRAQVVRDRGLGLLFRFLLATSIVVAVVLLAAAVDKMWILFPAMAIHLAVTFVVIQGLFRLLTDGYESDVPQ
jgi:hypothetical protein